MFEAKFKHRSGRVIALGRTLLAAVFLLAIWIDPTQPAQAAEVTYALLAGYLAIGITIILLTWDNWWLDAKLAKPAHVLDILAFTLLVAATEGYTSPFFVFFVFLILSASIRWGWRETALTAVAVVLLYLATGIAVGSATSPDFDLQRFIIRSGHLIVVSAILSWFGISQGFTSAGHSQGDLLPEPSLEDAPLVTALIGIMRSTGASRGLLLWRKPNGCDWTSVHCLGLECDVRKLTPDPPGWTIGDKPFLFEIRNRHALTRGRHRQFQFFSPAEHLDPELLGRSAIAEGLAIPIRTETGEGQLLLSGIDSLCTDHIDLGMTIGAALAGYMDRHALLSAVNDSAAARARLSLSRDLHDSIVQFLAGATFRVEAIKRAIESGDGVEHDISELKQLLLEEQQDLRSAIGALRNDRIALPRLAADLKCLCSRLSRQWDVDCRFNSDVAEISAPMRLHLDTHQLVRETVANAVRHAGAKSLQVRLSSDSDNLILEVMNDGASGQRVREGSPWSLKERVDEANGTLLLASGDTGTVVSVTLPLNEEGA